MNKAIMIIMLIIFMLILIDVNADAKEIENGNNNDYAIVTVYSTYDNIWEIEYDGNIYVYENLDFPKDTVYIIADIKGNYPKLIMNTEITNCTKNLKTFGDFVNRQQH